ncbi:hypothetical protein Tco_0846643 [Tanacetum coccineum]
MAQKHAEESIKIEKFRSVEMEQAGIKANQKKEEQWEKELKTIKNQHAADLVALVSATQELEKVKRELVMTRLLNAKFESEADQCNKMVTELNLEIETLKFEVEKREKLVLELKSEIETLKSEGEENDKLILELKSEVGYLKSEENNLKSDIENLNQEVKKAKVYKEKLVHIEASFKELNA